MRVAGAELATLKSLFVGRSRAAFQLTLGSDSNTRNALILEKVQGDLAAGLGIQSEIRLLDWKSYLRQLGTAPPPVFRFAWMMPFADPILLLRVFVTGNPNNLGHFSDPIYDELVAKIGRLEKGEERAKLIRLAQTRLVHEQAALVPLYHYVQTSAVAPRLKGFRVSAFGTLEFSELRI
jgi:oligopeptide transport system substrate-binding protein